MIRRIIQFGVGFGAGIAILLWALAIPVHWKALDQSLLRALSENSENLQQTQEKAIQEGRWALVQWAEAVQQGEEVQAGAGKESLEASRFKEHSWQREWRNALGMQQEFWWTTEPTHALVDGNLFAFVYEWSGRRPYALSKKIRSLEGLTGRQFFPAAGSKAERPWRIALELMIWLVQTGSVSPSLESEWSLLIDQVRAEDPGERMIAIQRLEGALVSLLSLGRRLNWEELPVTIRSISKVEELSSFAQMAAQYPEEKPMWGLSLFYLGRIHPLLNYRAQYPDTWLESLHAVIPYGREATRTLILEGQEIYRGPLISWISIAGLQFPEILRVTPQQVTAHPESWIWIKTAGLLIASFFLSLALMAAFKDQATLWNRRGAKTALWYPLLLIRQTTIALFLGAVLMWIVEPSLLRSHLPDAIFENAGFTIQLQNDLIQTEGNDMIPEFDNLTWLMLGIFFTLQLMVYIIGLLKVSQIRGLQLAPELKLELLNNEENLFDCGLYLGLAGTITALVMLSMKILQPSLAAAYSSTLFGIIFVALLKIGHVRPYRRRLLLNKENIVAL